MPAIKNLLKDASVDRAVASTGRKCHHSKKHRISQNELFLYVRNPGTVGGRNYCSACARAMLDLARESLHEIESMLYSNQ